MSPDPIDVVGAIRDADPFADALDAVAVEPGPRGVGLALRCRHCPHTIPIPKRRPTVGDVVDAAARHWATAHDPKGGER